jgi:hypothetical protein
MFASDLLHSYSPVCELQNPTNLWIQKEEKAWIDARNKKNLQKLRTWDQLVLQV